ncbi:peptidase [Haloplanus sp. GCM10025708]|uniref:peptidase n=1 Tax=Haloferacaceae TaxID=1644056 RepID=UPI00360C3B5F
MVSLQTAPASLGPAVAVIPVLLLVGFAAGALGDAVVRRLPNPVGKYRLLYAAVLFPLVLLSYAFLAFLGLGPALADWLHVPTEILGRGVANFVEFLAAGLVWLVAYAPTVRGVRDVRDLELSTRQALSKMGRYVVGLSVVMTSVVTPLQIVPSGDSPLVLGIGLACIGLGFLYASPWLVPILRSTKAPTDGTAERLTTLCRRAGLDVRDVHVLDTDDEETANTLVRGPPGYRRLFVTTTFLERFDDGTATALLAVEAGRLRASLLELRASTVVVAGLALVASVTGVGPRWPLLGVSLAVLLGGFWCSRRAVRTADDYAGERTTPAAVAEALERYADVHALEPTRRRFPNPLSINVALGDRIDRLRRQETEDVI